MLKHKKLLILAILLVAGGGYYYFRSQNANVSQTTYTVQKVEKGNVITTVSGSGSVSASNQVDVKPEVSANIVSINVKAGQKVKKGDVLAVLNKKDLQKALKDAKNSLDVAQANLKLKVDGATAEEIAVSKNSVDSAKLSYDNAKTNLEDVKTSNAQDIAKAQLTLDNSKLSLENAQRSYNDALANKDINNTSTDQDFENTYTSAKNTINSSYVTLRSSYNTIDGILHTSNDAVKRLYGVQSSQSVIDANSSFDQAKIDLDNFEKKYTELSKDWSHDGIESLLASEMTAMQSMKTLAHNMYTLMLNTITSNDLTQSTLDGYKSTMSSQESSAVSGVNSIQSAINSISSAKLTYSSSGISSASSLNNAKSSLESAQNSYQSSLNSFNQTKVDNEKSLKSAQSDLAAKKISYDSAVAQYNTKIAKPTEAELISYRVQVSQALESYEQAKEDLDDADVKAPFDGIVGTISLVVGDAASPSTAICTMVTENQLATITLNEVDIVKVKAGQKANVTFSAIDDLEITGEVAEIDTIGTVSQNVVSYSVKIAFDTQDSRVKPKMSASVVITTNEEIDVVVVPNSAIKTSTDGESSYVEAFSENKISSGNSTTVVGTGETISKKTITTGLSDDTYTEVLSGINEGDEIITKTSTASVSSQKTTTSQSGMSLFGSMGGGQRR